jgi:molybdate transport system permease protein
MEMPQTIISPLLLTLKIAAISTLFVAVLGLLIAYLLAKKEFKGKWLADILLKIALRACF